MDEPARASARVPGRQVRAGAPSPGPDTARLFVALWPGDRFQRALHAWCKPWLRAAGTRPVAPRQLHLTLHFLGEVPRARLPALRSALRVPFPTFPLEFTGCEGWPHGLLVAKPDARPEPLIALHATLGEALARLGLALDSRPFRPHVTLARHHAGAVPAAAAQPLVWTVTACALVESEARSGGSYVVLEHWRGRPGPAAAGVARRGHRPLTATRCPATPV